MLILTNKLTQNFLLRLLFVVLCDSEGKTLRMIQLQTHHIHAHRDLSTIKFPAVIYS